MPYREKVHFPSQRTSCAAWHYPGVNGACVVMAPGIAVTKEAGTDLIAERFAAAGYSVLTFEYRRLGESGGEPRQLVNVNDQLEDWQAALAFARTLPEVDPRRIAVWGFSLSGGHIYKVAARNPDLAAAIVHAGIADGPHAARNIVRSFTPWALFKFNVLGLLDAVGGRLGRAPILIPLYGEPNEVVSIATPDSKNGPRALNPGGRYDDTWRQEVAARSAVAMGFYRPGREAGKIRIPVLVLEFQDDGVTPAGPAAKAAERAPRGELVRLRGGHYAALLDGHDECVEVMLDFLNRHVLDRTTEVAAKPAAAA